MYVLTEKEDLEIPVHYNRALSELLHHKKLYGTAQKKGIALINQYRSLLDTLVDAFVIVIST